MAERKRRTVTEPDTGADDEQPRVIDLRTPPEPALTRRSARARERSHETVPETAESLTADRLLHRHREAPENGWRRELFRATGGSVRPGESPQVLRRRSLEARVRSEIRSSEPLRFSTAFRIKAPLSAKGSATVRPI